LTVDAAVLRRQPLIVRSATDNVDLLARCQICDLSTPLDVRHHQLLSLKTVWFGHHHIGIVVTLIVFAKAKKPIGLMAGINASSLQCLVEARGPHYTC
jgi:hypothetical protein